MKRNKENGHIKSFNVRLTESEYEQLTRIKKQFKKPASQLIRDSIVFYSMYYKDEIGICSIDA